MSDLTTVQQYTCLLTTPYKVWYRSALMNDIQTKVTELQSKGWTLAAIADEVGLTVNAVEKWKAGDRCPANSKAVLSLLEKLAQRKRIPKQRRYSQKRRK